MAKRLKKSKLKKKMSLNDVKRKRGSDCEQYPAFSFRYLTKTKEHNFDYFEHEKSNEVFRTLLQRLKEISKESYTYWNNLGKHKGIEMIDYWQCNINPCDLKLSPDDKIIVFRFYHQNYRILGIRLESCPTLHIIGFDFNYSAYNHGS